VNLRDMLKRDFGLELNISGGGGQSRDDPIVVLDSNRVDAAKTEMDVLRGLGIERGMLWTTLARTPVQHNGALFEQIKIGTKLVTQSVIITQRENYYFDVSMAGDAEKIIPALVAFVDKKTKLALPYEFGWLHFDGITDHEPRVPGLGESLAYGALGIKATVYVYDRLRTDIGSDVNTGIGRNEFDSAVQELVAFDPSASQSGEFSGGSSLLIETFRTPSGLSVVGLAICRGKFVKLRVSLADDPVLVDVVKESIAAFEELVTAEVQRTFH